MADTNYIRVEKYLKGEMDAGELKLFEIDLANDPELANDLKLQKDVNGFIINYKDKNDFKKFLNGVHQDIMNKNSNQEDTNQEDTNQQHKQNTNPKLKNKKNSNFIYWSVAATILALLIFTVVLKLANKKKSNETLFAEYYQARKPLNLRSPDTLQNGLANDCMKKYSEKNYKDALVCFKELLNQNNKNKIGIFFSGISYIETRNFENAISCFNQLTDTNDIYFRIPSIWYSGLCYLKENKIDSALVCFNKLTIEDNYYKKQAVKIIGELK